ncbi:MAG: hypothetical protein ACYS47_04100 [Planctomycetota bacterium]|jgi:hypothetical protein
MKWHIGITVVAVLAIVVAAQRVKNDREEKAADKAFQEAADRGEEVYREACTACHEAYDPRFFVYDEWARLLADRGCPRVSVSLKEDQVGSIKDFFRKRGAPSEDEAETVRSRVRARFRRDRIDRGSVLYGSRCASADCHPHPYFVKVRTAQGWEDVVDDLAAFHPGLDEPVWIDPEKEAVDLNAFLASRAAGTASAGPRPRRWRWNPKPTRSDGIGITGKGCWRR